MLFSLKMHGKSLKEIEQLIGGNWLRAVKKDWLCIYFAPESKLSEAILLEALKQVPDINFEDVYEKFIKDHLFTAAICRQVLVCLDITMPKDYLQFLDSRSMEERRFIIKLLLANFYTVNGMSTKGALLTLAQITARKANYQPNEFKPTLLQSLEEYMAYLKILKSTAGPFRERFIVSDGHWVAGEIYKTTKGKIHILLIDPLGIRGIRNDYVQFYGYNAIKECAAIFPGVTIHVPYPRQKDGHSCGKFALDDLRRLYTIENNLPLAFRDSGLWGYIESIAKTENSIKRFDLPLSMCGSSCIKASIARFDLPLPMCRSSQFYDELTTSLTKRPLAELNTPLNKKGLLFNSEYIKSIFSSRERKKKGIVTTVHLNHYFEGKDKIRIKNNIDYIANTRDIPYLQASMNQFTFEAFKQRWLSRPKAPSFISSFFSGFISRAKSPIIHCFRNEMNTRC